MKLLRVMPRHRKGRPLEEHDVTHRHPSEVERLREVLTLAYPGDEVEELEAAGGSAS